MDVLKALTKIALVDEKKDVWDEASALKAKLENFSFVLLIFQQAKVLEHLHAVSQMLQRKDADIQKAVCLIQNAVQCLTTYREDFAEVKRSAQAVAQKWGVRCEFTQVRARRVRRHYDELCEDERLSDPESLFRVNVFNASLDIIINQLLQRFVSLRETSALFQAIQPSELNSAPMMPCMSTHSALQITTTGT